MTAERDNAVNWESKDNFLVVFFHPNLYNTNSLLQGWWALSMEQKHLLSYSWQKHHTAPLEITMWQLSQLFTEKLSRIPFLRIFVAVCCCYFQSKPRGCRDCARKKGSSWVVTGRAPSSRVAHIQHWTLQRQFKSIITFILLQIWWR